MKILKSRSAAGPTAPCAALLPLFLTLPSPQGSPPCELTGTQVVDDLANGAVALSGDTLVVNSGPGVAYVLVESGGTWSIDQTLSLPNTAHAFALEGDTLLIGLPSNDDGGTDAGAVAVFERMGGTWSLADTLYADAPASGELFGNSVAMEGDVAWIGSPGRGVGGSSFVFERVRGTWTRATELQADPPESGGRFGHAVAVSGNTAAAVDRYGDGYVFVESGGVWTQQAQIVLPEVEPNLQTRSVALSGDTVIFGQGFFGALVFDRDGSTWNEVFSIPPTDDSSNVAVALEGDLAVVANADLFVPSVALYARAGTTWSLLADLLPHDFDLGRGLALDGGRVASAGKPFFPSTVYEDVYLYDVPSFVAPSVGFRNAGTNPDSFTAGPAYVGQSLDLTVDLTTTGHDQALVIGFDSPFGLTLGGGQTLLCFDLLGSGGELINTGFHAGPIAEIELPVPNDLAFAGFFVCTQAIHAFGVVPFALSNAQDIVIGACL